MKKAICIFFVLCLLFTFAGCHQDPDNEKQNLPTGESGLVSSGGQITQGAMAAVSVPAVTESVKADDGTVIFNYTYQTMSLTLPDPDVADKVIIDFLNRVDKTHTTAESVLASAKVSYAGSADWTPYLCSITYDPTRIDQGVLSLFGSNVTYSGTSHPERTCVSASYDLLTGDVLTLASIMSADASVDSFCQLVLDALAGIEEEKYLYESYDKTVKQRFAGDESQDEAWYFTQTGLCFYFAPYEIAPYTSGVITVEIPYEKLTGLMYDGYFPAEQDTASGTVKAQRLSDADTEQFTQITEVIFDNDGEMVLLYTDSSVQDVRIEVGSWDASGTQFTASYTAFATYALTPGDAVMVQTDIPDTLPNLRLLYRTGSETVTVYISQSGKTGSILLLDN